MSKIKEKLKDILEEKYFLFEECMIDSLIRVDSKGVGSFCKECTVSNIRNEDLLNVVFCPLLMKIERDLVK